MKEIHECDHMEGGEGRKKTNEVNASRWKLDESILNRKLFRYDSRARVSSAFF